MQRVAISRALIMDPPVLLADEPTGNLDSKSGRIVMDLLRGATDKRRTIILVTHDPRLASEADRVLTMRDGQLRLPTSSSTREGDVEEGFVGVHASPRKSIGQARPMVIEAASRVA